MLSTTQDAYVSFVECFAPVLSTPALLALRHGLATNAPELIQNNTCIRGDICSYDAFEETPTDYECVAACAIGYAGWKGLNLHGTKAVQAYFDHTCLRADPNSQHAMQGDRLTRHFLNWFDITNRTEMRHTLTEWIDSILARVPVSHTPAKG